MERFFDWIAHAREVLGYSKSLIIWNLFLAYIPLVLSVWLFRIVGRRSLLWWVVFAVFIAFLPNAPYILTDIIHLIELIRQGYSVWTITLVLIPQYLIFILAGMEAYVISLINLGYYCYKLGWGKYISWIELITHALCSLGIYLGRFQRFNSWDIVTKPDNLMDSIVDNLTGKWSVLMMSVTFLILVVLYWFMKEITLGLIFRFRDRKKY
ncbi:MAG: DUF1361 domain-containing protein [Hydrococcus sp. C42_A2020_068]|uniref:DUF1361 domain-containing protein n=1 Tax=Pleurocapsa sp. PCC 7327 TaxID=118163 RepID=UPI00029FC57B|nr:DUF1361 domain-containing protein [Pleurocapsa sp. PCC 7327]AFY75638.1 putative membrane protein [Pleurocapsa sp. PCC 7327]MBF2020509.1 DUF1361 domain-containing protein [Hydrococcus sp. C42_A2020_068]